MDWPYNHACMAEPDELTWDNYLQHYHNTVDLDAPFGGNTCCPDPTATQVPESWADCHPGVGNHGDEEDQLADAGGLQWDAFTPWFFAVKTPGIVGGDINDETGLQESPVNRQNNKATEVKSDTSFLSCHTYWSTDGSGAKLRSAANERLLQKLSEDTRAVLRHIWGAKASANNTVCGDATDFQPENLPQVQVTETALQRDQQACRERCETWLQNQAREACGSVGDSSQEHPSTSPQQKTPAMSMYQQTMAVEEHPEADVSLALEITKHSTTSSAPNLCSGPPHDTNGDLEPRDVVKMKQRWRVTQPKQPGPTKHDGSPYDDGDSEVKKIASGETTIRVYRNFKNKLKFWQEMEIANSDNQGCNDTQQHTYSDQQFYDPKPDDHFIPLTHAPCTSYSEDSFHTASDTSSMCSYFSDYETADSELSMSVRDYTWSNLLEGLYRKVQLVCPWCTMNYYHFMAGNEVDDPCCEDTRVVETLVEPGKEMKVTRDPHQAVVDCTHDSKSGLETDTSRCYHNWTDVTPLEETLSVAQESSHGVSTAGQSNIHGSALVQDIGTSTIQESSKQATGEYKPPGSGKQVEVAQSTKATRVKFEGPAAGGQETKQADKGIQKPLTSPYTGPATSNVKSNMSQLGKLLSLSAEPKQSSCCSNAKNNIVEEEGHQKTGQTASRLTTKDGLSHENASSCKTENLGYNIKPKESTPQARSHNWFNMQAGLVVNSVLHQAVVECSHRVAPLLIGHGSFHGAINVDETSTPTTGQGNSHTTAIDTRVSQSPGSGIRVEQSTKTIQTTQVKFEGPAADGQETKQADKGIQKPLTAPSSAKTTFNVTSSSVSKIGKKPSPGTATAEDNQSSITDSAGTSIIKVQRNQKTDQQEENLGYSINSRECTPNARSHNWINIQAGIVVNSVLNQACSHHINLGLKSITRHSYHKEKGVAPLLVGHGSFHGAIHVDETSKPTTGQGNSHNNTAIDVRKSTAQDSKTIQATPVDYEGPATGGQDRMQAAGKIIQKSLTTRSTVQGTFNMTSSSVSKLAKQPSPGYSLKLEEDTPKARSDNWLNIQADRAVNSALSQGAVERRPHHPPSGSNASGDTNTCKPDQKNSDKEDKKEPKEWSISHEMRISHDIVFDQNRPMFGIKVLPTTIDCSPRDLHKLELLTKQSSEKRSEEDVAHCAVQESLSRSISVLSNSNNNAPDSDSSKPDTRTGQYKPFESDDDSENVKAYHEDLGHSISMIQASLVNNEHEIRDQNQQRYQEMQSLNPVHSTVRRAIEPTSSILSGTKIPLHKTEERAHLTLVSAGGARKKEDPKSSTQVDLGKSTKEKRGSPRQDTTMTTGARAVLETVTSRHPSTSYQDDIQDELFRETSIPETGVTVQPPTPAGHVEAEEEKYRTRHTWKTWEPPDDEWWQKPKKPSWLNKAASATSKEKRQIWTKVGGEWRPTSTVGSNEEHSASTDQGRVDSGLVSTETLDMERKPDCSYTTFSNAGCSDGTREKIPGAIGGHARMELADSRQHTLFNQPRIPTTAQITTSPETRDTLGSNAFNVIPRIPPMNDDSGSSTSSMDTESSTDDEGSLHTTDDEESPHPGMEPYKKALKPHTERRKPRTEAVKPWTETVKPPTDIAKPRRDEYSPGVAAKDFYLERPKMASLTPLVTLAGSSQKKSVHFSDRMSVLLQTSTEDLLRYFDVPADNTSKVQQFRENICLELPVLQTSTDGDPTAEASTGESTEDESDLQNFVASVRYKQRTPGYRKRRRKKKKKRTCKRLSHSDSKLTASYLTVPASPALDAPLQLPSKSDSGSSTSSLPLQSPSTFGKPLLPFPGSAICTSEELINPGVRNQSYPTLEDTSDPLFFKKLAFFQKATNQQGQNVSHHRRNCHDGKDTRDTSSSSSRVGLQPIKHQSSSLQKKGFALPTYQQTIAVQDNPEADGALGIMNRSSAAASSVPDLHLRRGQHRCADGTVGELEPIRISPRDVLTKPLNQAGSPDDGKDTEVNRIASDDPTLWVHPSFKGTLKQWKQMNIAETLGRDVHGTDRSGSIASAMEIRPETAGTSLQTAKPLAQVSSDMQPQQGRPKAVYTSMELISNGCSSVPNGPGAGTTTWGSSKQS